MGLINLFRVEKVTPPPPGPVTQHRLESESSSYHMFSLSSAQSLSTGAFTLPSPCKRYCIECSIRGAGPDLRLNSADEVKQKAEREAPRAPGGGWGGGPRGGMPLILQTKRARPQSSSIPSLIRKKDSLSAPSPTRRSICEQATAKLMHFSSLPQEALW